MKIFKKVQLPLKLLVMSVIATSAMFLAERTAYASPWWIMHQPRIPKCLLKK